MNARKKMIACATLVIALFTVTSAHAQRGGGMMDTAAMRQRMEARVAKAKTDLSLTQVQADSLKAILTDANNQRRALFQSIDPQSTSRDEIRAKMQPITDATNNRIQAVFGADLFKKYQDWEQQNRPQRGGGGGGYGGGGRGNGNGQQ